MMLRSGPPDPGAAALWMWVRSYAKPARLVCRNRAETVSARSIRPMPDDWRRQPPRSMSPSTFRPRRSGLSIGCPAESILDPAEDARGDKQDRGDHAYRNNQNQPRSVVNRQRNPVARSRDYDAEVGHQHRAADWGETHEFETWDRVVHRPAAAGSQLFKQFLWERVHGRGISEAMQARPSVVHQPCPATKRARRSPVPRPENLIQEPCHVHSDLADAHHLLPTGFSRIRGGYRTCCPRPHGGRSVAVPDRPIKFII